MSFTIEHPAKLVRIEAGLIAIETPAGKFFAKRTTQEMVAVFGPRYGDWFIYSEENPHLYLDIAHGFTGLLDCIANPECEHLRCEACGHLRRSRRRHKQRQKNKRAKK